MTNQPQPLPTRRASLRERIHEIIFEAHTFSGIAFDLLLLVAIIASIGVISMETVESFQKDWPNQLFYLKWFFTILFTIEYLLRVYCVKKPLKYIFSFWGIIDLISFLPDYILLIVAWNTDAEYVSSHFAVIRSLRLMRVFRILKLSWFQQEADDLGNAVWQARGKIVVFLSVVMIIVTVAGTVMYEVENQLAPKETIAQSNSSTDAQDESLDEKSNRGGQADDKPNDKSTSQFTSIPTGIYWAIVTMTTVGFGDIVPVTAVGKVISAILILLGYSLIIVPTGFVSAEVLKARSKKNVTTFSCSSCITEGHDEDAIYCKFCGEKL